MSDPGGVNGDDDGDDAADADGAGVDAPDDEAATSEDAGPRTETGANAAPEAVDDPVEAEADDRSGEGTPESTPVDVEALIGPERRLDPRVRLLWALRGATVAVVLGLVAGVAAVVAARPVAPVAALGAFTVAFALAGVHAWLRYRAWRYRVRADSLFLDRGVLTRVRTVVPYVRIQHVDVSRGPAERALGLSTVVVYTAGTRGADVTVPGLPPARADDLQERLKRLAIAAEGEDAV